MRNSSVWLLSSAMAAVLSTPAAAADLVAVPEPVIVAEETAKAPDGDAQQQRDDRDILVTGVRLDDGQARPTGVGVLGDKPLLDTPFSLSVVDSEDIARRQVTTIGQVFVNDPAVFSYASSGTVNWWGTQIRGLGVRNYYIDDVPLMLYWGGDFPLESVADVTALKGLTGFMYGFGAPGGTISYRTKRPTAEPLLATEIGYRTNSVFYGRVDAGGPLTQDGKLGYRFNLAGEKGTAYNQAKVNRWMGSLALEYAFSPDVKWYATATYEDSKLEREPFHIYWDSYEDSELPDVTYDYDKVNIDNSFYEARTLAVATGLRWDFAKDWKAKLTYGYNSKKHGSNKMFINILNQDGDYSGSAYNFAWLDKSHFAQAMLQGSFGTGPVRHDIVAGAAYIGTRSYASNEFYWSNDFDGNIYQDQPFRVTRDIDFSLSDEPTQEQQRALFVSDTMHLGEHLQAIVGGRYTWYKAPATGGDPTSEYKTSNFSPTLALIVKPAAYATLYGSYVESLEPGTRVGGEYVNFGELLKATVSKQYEAGVKYEHKGLSLAAAAFRIERVNTADRIVDGDVDGNGLPDRFLSQDGLSTYKGIEGTASYRFGQDFRLGGGVIYLDPELSKLSPDEDGNPSPIEGNIPAEAAKWQVTANADYYVSAVPGLSLFGNVRYFGKGPTSDANTLFIPSRTIGNMGVQYETAIGGRKVTFTGNLNNLTNEKYWSFQNFGEGRNGSLSVRVAW